MLGALLLLRAVRVGIPFEGRRPSRRVVGWLVVGIVAVVVQNLGIYGAFQETSVLVALVVFYSYPVLIAVASAVLGLERMDGRRAIALGVAFLGCVIVVLGGGESTGEIALNGRRPGAHRGGGPDRVRAHGAPRLRLRAHAGDRDDR